MKKYEYTEHTADIGLKVYGKSLEEIFANAAAGLFSLIVEEKLVEAKQEKTIIVKADDPEGLLVEWLNELIYQFEVNELLVRHVKIVSLSKSGKNLHAIITGESYNPKRHQIDEQIKACTYHQLKIKKNKTWTAWVVLDV